MASTTAFEVTLTGTGTHAAFPHTGTDVVVAAAHVVTALQTIASRWDPVDPVVVSICHLQAGQTYNVLPETCSLKGTVRGLRQSTHDQVLERVQAVIAETAGMFGCSTTFVPVPGYPTLVNDPTCANLVAQVASDLYGPDTVDSNPPPVMVGEDFSFYARTVPSALFCLGVGDRESAGRPGCPGLHSPNFDFPDEAIPIGVGMFCEIAQRFLAAPPSWSCG
jgi:amidohydrolase